MRLAFGASAANSTTPRTKQRQTASARDNLLVIFMGVIILPVGSWFSRIGSVVPNEHYRQIFALGRIGAEGAHVGKQRVDGRLRCGRAVLRHRLDETFVGEL